MLIHLEGSQWIKHQDAEEVLNHVTCVNIRKQLNCRNKNVEVNVEVGCPHLVVP